MLYKFVMIAFSKHKKFYLKVVPPNQKVSERFYRRRDEKNMFPKVKNMADQTFPVSCCFRFHAQV